jgi:hypothetical protein
MRRALRVLTLGGLVVWLLRRRASAAAHAAEGVTIGFDDGTSTVLEIGSPERELLIAAAGDAA